MPNINTQQNWTQLNDCLHTTAVTLKKIISCKSISIQDVSVTHNMINDPLNTLLTAQASISVPVYSHTTEVKIHFALISILEIQPYHNFAHIICLVFATLLPDSIINFSHKCNLNFSNIWIYELIAVTYHLILYEDGQSGYCKHTSCIILTL